MRSKSLGLRNKLAGWL
ncbi:hypothetical protein LINPERPRIM_LOCUS8542 [Linum perenne]